jgi:hypothetical protein
MNAANATPVAALAQPVEHRIRNARVRCSSHLSGTTFPNPTIDIPSAFPKLERAGRMILACAGINQIMSKFFASIA